MAGTDPREGHPMPTPTRRAAATLVAAGILRPAAPAVEAGEPRGIVSRFKADDDTADAEGPNGGVAVGNVAYAPGALDHGFSLDGASYVDVAAPTFDAYGSAFTIAGWIKIGTFAQTAPV